MDEIDGFESIVIHRDVKPAIVLIDTSKKFRLKGCSVSHNKSTKKPNEIV
jgi:hypothetical protein